MPKVYGYTRVSDELQIDGPSMDTQHYSILKWWNDNKQSLTEMGYEFAGVFTDPAQSAVKINLKDRPQGKILMAALRRGDLLVAPDFERLFRSPGDYHSTMERLKRLGVYMLTLDMPDMDWTSEESNSELMGSIMAAVKRSEAKTISRRMRVAYATKEERNIVTGSFIPPGWRRVARYDGKKIAKHHVPCPHERAFLRVMAHVYKNDRQHWCKRSFMRWVKETPKMRRTSGSLWKWEHFRMSPVIVSHDFPTVNLSRRPSGSRLDLLGALVGRVPQLPSPASQRPLPPKMPKNWAVLLKQAPGNVSSYRLRHQLGPKQDAEPQAQASQQQCG